MNGLVLIDKPSGPTSHDVVNRWRRLSGMQRAGHLGTLDPMATGLLLVVSGTATRLSQFFADNAKTYLAEIAFGLRSDTYDVEGVVSETNAPIPTESAVVSALDQFRGRFLQTPPPISAKKIRGVPAYKLARKNIDVELRPVEVEVSALDVLGFSASALRIRVRCAAGTYIRSIAHDLGNVLGCGGVLRSLRRTEIGDRQVESAWTLEGLAELAGRGEISTAVLPSAEILLTIPAQYVDELAEQHIRHGREFRTLPFTVPPGAPLVRAISRSGDLVCIGELKYPNVYAPRVVL